jgi:hypothetical protein
VDANLMGAAAGDRHLHQVCLGGAFEQGEATAGGQVAGLGTSSGTPNLAQLRMFTAADCGIY